MKNNLNKLAGLAIALLGTTAIATGSYADFKTVAANISFDYAVVLTKNADIQFGTVAAGTVESYTITTAGAVTAQGSSNNVLYGTTAAGNILVQGSTTQTVAISIGNEVSNNGVDIHAGSETCSYGGGASSPCGTTAMTAQAAPGQTPGKTLLLGVRVDADGSQVAGSSAAPHFDVTVVYG
jgi:hypothetical protein